MISDAYLNAALLIGVLTLTALFHVLLIWGIKYVRIPIPHPCEHVMIQSFLFLEKVFGGLAVCFIISNTCWCSNMHHAHWSSIISSEWKWRNELGVDNALCFYDYLQRLFRSLHLLAVFTDQRRGKEQKKL